MVDILDREAVLAKRRRSYKILELPSGGTARLQSLTEKERSEYEMCALDKQGRPTKTGLADARRLLIAMMWVDADVNRLFDSDGDIEHIKELPAADASAIFDACLDFSGFADSDVEELVKN